MAEASEGRTFYEATPTCLFCGHLAFWLVVENATGEAISACPLHKYTPFS